MSQPIPHTETRRHIRLFPIAVLALSITLVLLLLWLFGIDPQKLLIPENRRFERFTEEVFRSELSGSTLNLHYTLADPKACGIKTEGVSLGNASLEAREKACASAENYLKALKEFDYEKLSEKHQLTYDIFQDYLETELSGSAYLLYDEPLSPTLGIQAQLPVLLAEYTFRTKGDIEDYLSLLAQIPDYFSSILAFEREKVSAGLFMSAAQAQAVAAQCGDFISDAKNNYLLELFDGKIDAVTNLTADEKIAYKNRNKAILEGYVFPAYQELARKIVSYSGSSRNSQGLYYLPEGAAYYEYLVRSVTGDAREIAGIEEAVKVQLLEDYGAMQEILQEMTEDGSSVTENGDAAVETAAPGFADAAAITGGSVMEAVTEGSGSDGHGSASAEAMLAELRQRITEDFPVLPEVSCQVKYVHESMQEYLSPAFYLTPAIDDYENNVIYINPGSNYSNLELFTTLAHEGYPGHLYQTVYFCAQEPDLLRNILTVGGYTEGWATYVEMYAYSLWDDDPTLASLYQRNRSFSLGLASLLDIGIHYRGYSLEDVTAFLQKLGYESDTADALYEAILESPANYLQYYVGYLNFCDLRDELQQAMGSSFTLKEYHRRVLEAGQAPFSILRKTVLEGAA